MKKVQSLAAKLIVFFAAFFISLADSHAQSWNSQVTNIAIGSTRKVNTPVEIVVTLKNTGTVVASYPVKLIIRQDGVLSNPIIFEEWKELYNIPVNATAAATFSWTPNEADDYQCTAEAWNWQRDYLNHTLNSQWLAVTALLSTSIFVDPKTQTVGNPVTLSAQLISAGAGVAGKSLHFYVGSNYLGLSEAPTTSAGNAYKSFTPTTSGSYTIRVDFVADGNYQGSTGSNTLTVHPKKNTEIAVTNKSCYVNQSIQLEARIKESGTSTYLGGMPIKFQIGSENIGTVNSGTDGYARINYTPTSAGEKTITAEFAGDTGYNSSWQQGNLSVALRNTSMTVTAKTVTEGNSVTLSARA